MLKVQSALPSAQVMLLASRSPAALDQPPPDSSIRPARWRSRSVCVSLRLGPPTHAQLCLCQLHHIYIDIEIINLTGNLRCGLEGFCNFIQDFKFGPGSLHNASFPFLHRVLSGGVKLLRLQGHAQLLSIERRKYPYRQQPVSVVLWLLTPSSFDGQIVLHLILSKKKQQIFNPHALDVWALGDGDFCSLQDLKVICDEQGIDDLSYLFFAGGNLSQPFERTVGAGWEVVLHLHHQEFVQSFLGREYWAHQPL
jgi:hypothetical protein